MGDTLQAHDRQLTTYSDQQDLTQVNSGRQSSEKSFPASGEHAPFYSQLGPFPQASHAPSTQHGHLHPSYQHQQPMHGLDMSSMRHALSGSSTSPTSIRGFPQQAPSHTDGMSAHTPGMNFGPHLHQYGLQAYPSNMAMNMPALRSQAHPSGTAPQYYYSGYNVPASQAPMQRQGQFMAGYPTMPNMPYNRSEFNNQSNQPVSYLSTSVLPDHRPSA